MTDTGAPYRPRPRLTALTEPYWTSGRDGVLRIQRCDACRFYVHPPGPVCPRCHDRALTFTAVSGSATVMAATVNHQPWYPDLDPPYVVAIVTIEEQDDVRLTTNIVNCAPDDVYIGMPVQVTFEHYDPVWLPIFEPRTGLEPRTEVPA